MSPAQIPQEGTAWGHEVQAGFSEGPHRVTDCHNQCHGKTAIVSKTEAAGDAGKSKS